jgi:hypothetical protein
VDGAAVGAAPDRDLGRQHPDAASYGVDDRRPRSAEDLGRATYVCSADPVEFANLGGRFLGEEIEAVAPAAVA